MVRELGMAGLDTILNRTNVGWKQLLSRGLRVFIAEQEPEDVNFVRHPNGWSIQVKTDEDNIEEAQEFWQDNIEGKL